MLWKVLIYDYIFPSYTTPPFQHSHLCYMQFLHVLLLDWPTFCLKGYSWSKRCHMTCVKYTKDLLSLAQVSELEISHNTLSYLELNVKKLMESDIKSYSI
eukprot:TRINITY_DN13742_c1_g2_i1.p1 TRINITY_DN13742_c1_g2~~TRINITY_DN13742_c1_g2_i1.p1  ORF type:complete len:100 (-),score=3.42 TRINITY_DN13742_c1_g2_i1:400-699(-)